MIIFPLRSVFRALTGNLISSSKPWSSVSFCGALRAPPGVLEREIPASVSDTLGWHCRSRTRACKYSFSVWGTSSAWFVASISVHCMVDGSYPVILAAAIQRASSVVSWRKLQIGVEMPKIIRPAETRCAPIPSHVRCPRTRCGSTCRETTEPNTLRTRSVRLVLQGPRRFSSRVWACR